MRADRQTDRMTDSTTTVCRGSAPRHNKVLLHVVFADIMLFIRRLPGHIADF